MHRRSAHSTLGRVSEEEPEQQQQQKQEAGSHGQSVPAQTPGGASGSAARGDMLRSASASSLAGMVLKARAASAAPTVAAEGSGDGNPASTSPQFPVSPASMQRQWRRGPQRTASSTRQSLERLLGEVGAGGGAQSGQGSRGSGSSSTSLRPSMTGAAAAGAAAAVAAGSRPSGSGGAGGSPSELGAMLTPKPSAASAAASLASLGSVRSSVLGSFTDSGLKDRHHVSQSSLLSKFSGASARPAALAAATSALQGAVYRLAASQGLAPGSPTASSGGAMRSAASSSQLHTATGSHEKPSLLDKSRSMSTAAVGAAGSAGGVGAMISPRSALEGRALSRLIAPVAEALSSPLRPNSASSSLGGAPVNGAASSRSETHRGNAVQPVAPGATASVSGSRAHTILQALATTPSQPPSAAAPSARVSGPGTPALGFSVHTGVGSADRSQGALLHKGKEGALSAAGGAGSGKASTSSLAGQSVAARLARLSSSGNTQAVNSSREGSGADKPGHASSDGAGASWGLSHAGASGPLSGKGLSSARGVLGAGGESGEGTEEVSLLAQRLSAMDEALRAIGA